MENYSTANISYAQGITNNGLLGFSLSFFIVVANIPVVIIFIKSTIQKEKFKNKPVLSLGIADFLCGVTLFMKTYPDVDGSEPNYFNCRFSIYLHASVLVVSGIHILSINIHRIFCMYKASSLNQQSIYLPLTILPWILGFTVCSIPIIWVNEEDDIPKCSFRFIYDDNLEIASLYFGIIGLLLQIGIVISVSTLMILLKKHEKQFPQSAIAKKFKRISITQFIITLYFLITTLPITVILLLSYSYQMPKGSRGIGLLIATINTIINPFTYLIRIKEYRKFLLFCKKQNPQVGALQQLGDAILQLQDTHRGVNKHVKTKRSVHSRVQDDTDVYSICDQIGKDYASNAEVRSALSRARQETPVMSFQALYVASPQELCVESPQELNVENPQELSVVSPQDLSVVSPIELSVESLEELSVETF